MDTLLRIELLGRLRAHRAGRVLTRFRTLKTGVLLAFLATYPHRSHSRESLIELLWPDAAPEAGRNQLSMALSFLRHPLEPPGTPPGAVLIANRISVQLNPEALSTDIADFESALRLAALAATPRERAEALEAATALYVGEFLPGYYDDWVLEERARLAELCLQALEQLSACFEHSGDPERALRAGHRALGMDPLKEANCERLMRLYASSGQPTPALRVYREWQERLLQETGELPSPAMAACAARLQDEPTDALRREAAEQTPSEAAGRRKTTRSRKLERDRPAENTTTQHLYEGHAEGLTSDLAAPRPERAYPSTLPLHARRFIGRKREIDRVRRLLLPDAKPATTLVPMSARLVTLTGPGGVGKTRLAVEAAGQVVEALSGAVFFVGLSELVEAARIVGALVEGLKLARSPVRDPLDLVVEFLGRQSSLVVLDNFEQLLGQAQADASVEVVAALLERVPGLTLLVTSRQRLGLSGEREVVVAPLQVPPRDQAAEADGVSAVRRSGGATLGTVLAPEQLAEVESIALFVDRAQWARPDFQLTARNAASVSELCVRLEGLPLAIELAAARAQVLTPSQMLGQMRRRFAFLVGRGRGLEARHRTLGAAIDWSVRLLSPALRRLFLRLSVFRGGWSLEAAEVVCEEELVLDALSELRDCSLIVVEESGEVMRYGMLETLREYAMEQMSAEDWSALQARHLDYFLAWAEEVEPKLIDAEQAEWLQRLEEEHDNLRAALDWSVNGEEREEVHPSSFIPHPLCGSPSEQGLRLAGALRQFWQVHGHYREGREYFERLLERTSRRAITATRVKALSGAGVLASNQGDYASARAYHEESLTLYREIGDRSGIASSLHNLGSVAHFQGDFGAARALYEECLAICRELGDRRGIAAAFDRLGAAARQQGDFGAARALHEECLAICRELGDRRGIGATLNLLGAVALEQGDYELAWTHFEESLAIRRELGDRAGIAASLANLGTVASEQGELAQARVLLEESVIDFRALGDRNGLAAVLNNLGNLARDQGDCAQAWAHIEESLAIRRELGDRQGIAHSLHNLGGFHYDQGSYAIAQSLYEEGIIIYRELNERRGVAYSLESLARVLLARAEVQKAVRLWGASRALQESIGTSLPAHARQKNDQHLMQARADLGNDVFAIAWENGRTLTWEQAVDHALKKQL